MRGVGQALFSIAVLGMAALAVWVVVRTDWGGGGVPLSQVEASSVLPAGPGGESPVAPATEAGFTIRVGTYSGSENGRALAWAARDELESRGYPVADPVGVEQVAADGTVSISECQVIVGRAGSRAELEPLLARLSAISDWPTGDPRPFQDARIVSCPTLADR